MVILCGHEAEAREALEEVQTWTASVGRQLHPVKRRRVDAAQGGGLDFLGYHWERGYRWPRKKSLEKFQASIGAQTGRTNGQSLKAIILTVNRTLKAGSPTSNTATHDVPFFWERVLCRFKAWT